VGISSFPSNKVEVREIMFETINSNFSSNKIFIPSLVLVVGLAGAYYICNLSSFSYFSFSVSFFVLSYVTIWPIVRIYRSRTRSIDLASPLVLFGGFYFIYFAFSSIPAVVWRGQLVSQSGYEFFALAMLYAAWGYLGFLLGYQHILRGRSKEKCIITGNDSALHWKKETLERYFILFIGLLWFARWILISYGIFFKTFLGAQMLFQLPSHVRTLRLVAEILTILLFSLGCLWYYRFGRNKKSGKFIFGGYALLEVSYYFLANNRSRLLYFLVIVFLFWVFSGKRRMPIKGILAAVIIFVFLIMPLGWVMRNLSYSVVPSRAGNQQVCLVAFDLLPRSVNYLFHNYWESFATNRLTNYNAVRLSGLNLFAATLEERLDGRRPLLYGKTMYRLFPILVPRLIWPTKPNFLEYERPEGMILLHYGFFLRDEMITPVTELYTNFGVVGIFFGMIIFGLGFRYFWEYVRRKNFSDMAIVLYASAILPFVKMEMAIVPGVGIALRNMALIWIVCKIIDKTSKHERLKNGM